MSLASASACAEPAKITLELNKVEQQEKSCKATVVVNNPTDAAYKSIKLDIVLFRSDGVIGRRFAVDLAPMKANKRSVKSFELGEFPCEEVGSLLINDVMECATESGPADDCLAGISLSSLSKIQLSK